MRECVCVFVCVCVALLLLLLHTFTPPILLHVHTHAHIYTRAPPLTQTLTAPMSYALMHPAMGPEGYDWGALRARTAAPLHFGSSYEAIRAVATPQVE